MKEQRRREQRQHDALDPTQITGDQATGAEGAAWGLTYESTFQAASQGILEESFGVEMIKVDEFDAEGMVFGAPERVEIDLMICKGAVILCELKLFMSKPDIYTFARKADYYQRRHGRAVSRKIVISPMVRPEARPVAERLGIEVFGCADEVSAL